MRHELAGLNASHSPSDDPSTFANGVAVSAARHHDREFTPLPRNGRHRRRDSAGEAIGASQLLIRVRVPVSPLCAYQRDGQTAGFIDGEW